MQLFFCTRSRVCTRPLHSCGRGISALTTRFHLVSCPAPPTQKGRKGLVKRVAMPYPPECNNLAFWCALNKK